MMGTNGDPRRIVSRGTQTSRLWQQLTVVIGCWEDLDPNAADEPSNGPAETEVYPRLRRRSTVVWLAPAGSGAAGRFS